MVCARQVFLAGLPQLNEGLFGQVVEEVSPYFMIDSPVNVKLQIEAQIPLREVLFFVSVFCRRDSESCPFPTHVAWHVTRPAQSLLFGGRLVDEKGDAANVLTIRKRRRESHQPYEPCLRGGSEPTSVKGVFVFIRVRLSVVSVRSLCGG